MRDTSGLPALHTMSDMLSNVTHVKSAYTVSDRYKHILPYVASALLFQNVFNAIEQY